jgi:antitoxin component YwqK of YwqJK toxin-antitoxin module
VARPIWMPQRSGRRFDGMVTDDAADDSVRGEGSVDDDGRRHGPWQFVHRNGRLQARGSYEHGRLDGYWEWFRPNGQRLQSGSFELDVRTGLWRRWYSTGQLLDEGRYAAGRRVGEWRTYDHAGVVRQRKHHG